jgi:hypothetical protein
LSDSSDCEAELEYGLSPWSSSEERSATPVMSECTAAMVLMNLSHAQKNEKKQPPASMLSSKKAAASETASSSASAMMHQDQQRMMQLLQHRNTITEDTTQNSPQGT